MWQQLAAHGLQTFASVEAIEARAAELEKALASLCLVISAETGNVNVSGLQRARDLRSKPSTGGKSHYECINQLIHYWYCCAAARFLLQSGCRDLKMRPTAHDNMSDPDSKRSGDPSDVEACHRALGQICAEVFCVSPSLWNQKMADTRKKLRGSTAAIRAAFYNVDAKPAYKAKMQGFVVFGIHSPTGQVDEICSSYGPWAKLVAVQPSVAPDGPVSAASPLR